MANAQLTIHGEQQEFVVELSSSTLARLIELLPDHPDLGAPYGCLASHPDSRVRAAVAGKDQLPTAAIHLMVTDPALCVARELVTTSAVSQQLNSDEILTLCQRDPDLAALIAAHIEDFVLSDNKVIDFLESHSDANVREALAGNPFVPKAVLRRLALRDSDSGVRQSAGEILL